MPRIYFDQCSRCVKETGSPFREAALHEDGLQTTTDAQASATRQVGAALEVRGTDGLAKQLPEFGFQSADRNAAPVTRRIDPIAGQATGEQVFTAR